MDSTLRKAGRSVLLILVLVAFCGLGCDKKPTQAQKPTDKPEKPKTGKMVEPTPGKTPTPSPTPGKKTVSGPGVTPTPTPKPTPTPTPTPTPDGPKPVPTIGKVTPPPVVAPAPSLKQPADVIATVSVQSFDAVLGRVEKVVAQFKPMPLKALALAGLQKNLGFKSLDFFDTSKPIRFVVWSPSTSKKPLAIVVPITDQKKVIAALPEGSTPNADGNAYKVKVGPESGYLNFVAGHMVLTKDPGLFAKGKAFIGGPLSTAPQPHLFSLYVRVGVLTKMFGPQIDNLSRLATSGNLPMGAAGLVKKWVDGIVGFIKDIDSVAVHLVWTDKLLQLPLVFTPKAGSNLQSWANKVTSRSFSLVNTMPGSPLLGFSMNVDPKLFMSFVTKEMIQKAYRMTGPETAEFLGLLTKTMAQLTGESHMSFHNHGSFPFSFSSVTKVLDGPTYRQLGYQTFNFIFQKALRAAAPQLKGKVQVDQIKSFSDVIKILSPFAGTAGITLATGTDGVVDYLRVELNVQRFAQTVAKGNAEVEKQIKVWTALLGTKLEFAFGYGKDAVAFCFGPDAVSVAKKLANHQPAGTTTLAPIATSFTPHSVFAFYLSPIAIAKTIARLPIPQVAPFAKTLGGLEETGSLSLSVGGGQDVRAVLSVPMVDVMQLVKAGFNAYMQRMRP